jgi:hypothetical protein
MERMRSWADLFHHNGNGNRRGHGVNNHDPTQLQRLEELVHNLWTSRQELFSSLQYPGSYDIDKECHYPPTQELSPQFYRDLYDREPIARRICQLMSMECFAATPTVYEDERTDTITLFEEEWDNLGRGLMPDHSWYQDEKGSPIWEYLKRADILSGIGQFGVILLGIDDGRNLQDPVDGVEVVVNTTLKDLGGRVWNVREILPDSAMHPATVETATSLGYTQDESWGHALTDNCTWDRDKELLVQTDRGRVVLNRATGQVAHSPTFNYHKTYPKHGYRAVPLVPPLPGSPFTSTSGSNGQGGDGRGGSLTTNRAPEYEVDLVLNAPNPSTRLRVLGSYSDDPGGIVTGQPDPQGFHPGMAPQGSSSQEGPLDLGSLYMQGKAALSGSGPTGSGHSGPTYGGGGSQVPSGAYPPGSHPGGSANPQGPPLQGMPAFKLGDQGVPAPGAFIYGTETQHAGDQWSGIGMPPPESMAHVYPGSGRDGGFAPTGTAAGLYGYGSSLSGTDQQYFGIQFGPSQRFAAPPKDKRKLLFMRVFDESLVQVVRYEWNIRNPRFGLPVMYRITLNDPRQPHSGVGLPLATVYVHWSRCVHLADNRHASEIFGVPRMLPVLNPILDIRKIRGASAEGYWKSCFTGLSLETVPQLGGDVNVNRDELREMVFDYQNGLTRALMLMGISAKTLSPSVNDPTSHIAMHIEAICIMLGIPIRIFKGAERGELASSQDDQSWDERKRERQNNYLTPKVVVPFVDRLIQIGVLPQPGAGQVEHGHRPYEEALRGQYPPPTYPGVKPTPPAGGKGAPPGAGGPPGANRAQPQGAFNGNSQNPHAPGGVWNRMFWPQPVRSVRPALLRNANGDVIGYRAPAGYSILWPDIEALSPQDKVGLAVQKTTALTQYIAGNGESVISPYDYLTRFLELPEEEVEEILATTQAAHSSQDTMTNPPMQGGRPSAPQEGQAGYKPPGPGGPGGGAPGSPPGQGPGAPGAPGMGGAAPGAPGMGGGTPGAGPAGMGHNPQAGSGGGVVGQGLYKPPGASPGASGMPGKGGASMGAPGPSGGPPRASYTSTLPKPATIPLPGFKVPSVTGNTSVQDATTQSASGHKNTSAQVTINQSSSTSGPSPGPGAGPTVSAGASASRGSGQSPLEAVQALKATERIRLVRELLLNIQRRRASTRINENRLDPLYDIYLHNGLIYPGMEDGDFSPVTLNVGSEVTLNDAPKVSWFKICPRKAGKCLPKGSPEGQKALAAFEARQKAGGDQGGGEAPTPTPTPKSVPVSKGKAAPAPKPAGRMSRASDAHQEAFDAWLKAHEDTYEDKGTPEDQVAKLDRLIDHVPDDPYEASLDAHDAVSGLQVPGQFKSSDENLFAALKEGSDAVARASNEASQDAYDHHNQAAAHCLAEWRPLQRTESPRADDWLEAAKAHRAAALSHAQTFNATSMRKEEHILLESSPRHHGAPAGLYDEPADDSTQDGPAHNAAPSGMSYFRTCPRDRVGRCLPKGSMLEGKEKDDKGPISREPRDTGRGGAAAEQPQAPGSAVAPAAKGSAGAGDGEGRQAGDQPSGAGAPTPSTRREPSGTSRGGGVSGAGKEEQASTEGQGEMEGKVASTKGPSAPTSADGPVSADLGTINKRLDKFQNFFRGKGQHEVADWLGKLRDHVNNVGGEQALKELGGSPSPVSVGEARQHPVQYWGVATEEDRWKHSGDFIQSYLERNGISTVIEHSDPSKPLVSAYGKPDKYIAEHGDFKPNIGSFANKLEESKSIPGLEKSEDVSKLMGRPVTHLTDDVISKLDSTYGKGKWIVKAYGDEAAAGYGIFFPQRAASIKQDAQAKIWQSGQELSKYGFQHLRDPESNEIVGIKHSNGDEYRFGTPHYEGTIHGEARKWADIAGAATPHENGAMLPDEGKEFMVQPAFQAVGISDAERAAGKTWHASNEGRVHIVVKDGKAQVVPHATWLKGGNLPVVFHNDDTRAMEKAAQDIVNRLPAHARQNQVYAPDVMKTPDGYKVVELNPQGDAAGSGYLTDNHFTIDSYVSHLTGREPAHVRFIRKLLAGAPSTNARRLIRAAIQRLSGQNTYPPVSNSEGEAHNPEGFNQYKHALARGAALDKKSFRVGITEDSSNLGPSKTEYGHHFFMAAAHWDKAKDLDLKGRMDLARKHNYLAEKHHEVGTEIQDYHKAQERDYERSKKLHIEEDEIPTIDDPHEATRLAAEASNVAYLGPKEGEAANARGEYTDPLSRNAILHANGEDPAGAIEFHQKAYSAHVLEARSEENPEWADNHMKAATAHIAALRSHANTLNVNPQSIPTVNEWSDAAREAAQRALQASREAQRLTMRAGGKGGDTSGSYSYIAARITRDAAKLTEPPDTMERRDYDHDSVGTRHSTMVQDHKMSASARRGDRSDEEHVIRHLEAAHAHEIAEDLHRQAAELHRPVDNESYFAECERDSGGHCVGEGGGSEKRSLLGRLFGGGKPRIRSEQELNASVKSVPTEHLDKTAGTYTRPFNEKLSKGQKEAAEVYSRSGYKRMNEMLRNGEGDPQYDEHVQNLRGAFQAMPNLKEPVQVYRGVELPDKDAQQMLDRCEHLAKTGGTVTTKGFTSTSRSLDIAHKFVRGGDKPGKTKVLMSISTNHGVSGESAYDPEEYEMILDHGSKLKVLGVTTTKLPGGKTVKTIHLEHHR